MASARRGSKGAGPRREQVAHACLHCRTAKVKCSGSRPACSRCASKDLSCHYTVVEEGKTMREHIQEEMQQQKEELDRAMTVLHVLKAGSDLEASQTLARLRLGNSLGSEYDLIQQQQSRQTPRSVANQDLNFIPTTTSSVDAFNHPSPISPYHTAPPSNIWEAQMGGLADWSSYPLSPVADDQNGFSNRRHFAQQEMHPLALPQQQPNMPPLTQPKFP